MKKGNAMFLDAGLWIIYMGLGMLRWRDDDGAVVSARTFGNRLLPHPLGNKPPSFEIISQPDQ